MALYFYFNNTTGDLVYSDQATYSVEGYTSLGQQTNTNPTQLSDWAFNSKRASIKTVTKDPNISGQINILTSMISMFYTCSALTSLDLSGFDTSNVTDMYRMFNDCKVLTSLDLSNFDTSNVTNMRETFYYCSALTSLDLSNFDTSNVTSMDYTFFNCNTLRIIGISPNMSNVLSHLPADTYYDAITRQPYAKADIPGGSTYVRDQEDFELLTNIVQQAQMAQSINHRINKLNKKVNDISSGSNVDIVKVTEHKTSYTKDTLEVVVDDTGAVTKMYFITAE